MLVYEDVLPFNVPVTVILWRRAIIVGQIFHTTGANTRHTTQYPLTYRRTYQGTARLPLLKFYLGMALGTLRNQKRFII